MTDGRKFKTGSRRQRPGILVCIISSLNLLIVSDFEIRISDLGQSTRKTQGVQRGYFWVKVSQDGRTPGGGLKKSHILLLPKTRITH
jgi:hypothetical protein